MYNYKGYKLHKPSIKNIESKLLAIGLDVECVSRIEEIYLFLMYYLRALTLEQLCVFNDVLKTSILTSIGRIQKCKEVIDIQKDDGSNYYYTSTRKTLKVLKEFCEVEENRNYRNKKHLSKINDFYLTLFKSNCEKIKIDYEKNISYGDFIIRADAIINIENNGTKYEIILEQDNNTEKELRLVNKIEKYYNMILHEELLTDKVRFYVFRLDMFLKKNHIKKFEKSLQGTNKYKFLMEKIEELEEFYHDVKESEDISIFFDEAEKLIVEECDKKTSFLQNISSTKTSYMKCLEELEREYKIDFCCKIISNRVQNIKDAMFNEFYVEKFDLTGDDTVYKDISGKTIYDCTYGRIEGEDILLRTNIMCGDRKADYVLKKTLFSEENILIKVIKKYFKEYEIKPIKQVFKTIGYETLCFSNFISTTYNNNVMDFILLMPTISVSDYTRIKYMLNVDKSLLENSFDNNTIFVIVVDKDSNNHFNEMIHNFNSKKIKMNELKLKSN